MIGVFEFIILLVLISTVGKIFTSRNERAALPPAPPRTEELLQLNDAMGELHARVERLEEERDFYRALLDAPDRNRVQPPESGGGDR